MVKLLWKIAWSFLRKLNLELPYHPGIPLLGIYPKELKERTSTSIFFHNNFNSSMIYTSLKTLLNCGVGEDS